MQDSLAPAGWSATQPAPRPFVFRSGGLFGSGKKVRTIRAAVKHMDRHPDDGIYHLRNGTLAQWLEDQEADDLAALARQVANQRYTDPRVPLENFLIGTGLVRRPRLSLHPRKIRIGYVLAGQSTSCELQVKKGRGRGYLFGKLHSVVPWLDLDPTAFSGRPVKVRVGVNTETLPISKTPQEAQMAVESNATGDPVSVSVRFRVMGMPSRLNRYLLRPLAGLLVGGLIGAGLGWLLAVSGVGLPLWLPGLDRVSVPAPAVWAIVVGLLWALLAGIRGLRQPLAWPVLFTLGRWLLRTLIWAITLVLLAVVALWSWRQLDLELGWRVTPIPWSSALIAMLAVAIVPGILGELWNTRGARSPSSVARQMPLLRPGMMIASAAVICTLILTGAHFGAPLRQKFDPQAALAETQAWTRVQLTRFDATVNDAIDRVYIRLYDRRAPAQPTPAALPKLAPESGSQGLP